MAALEHGRPDRRRLGIRNLRSLLGGAQSKADELQALLAQSRSEIEQLRADLREKERELGQSQWRAEATNEFFKTLIARKGAGK